MKATSPMLEIIGMEKEPMCDKSERIRTMFDYATPPPDKTVKLLAGLLAPGQNIKGQDRAVARATGLHELHVKDIRRGRIEPRYSEYVHLLGTLMTQIDEQDRRNERIRDEHRRIAELLEPRSAERAGPGVSAGVARNGGGGRKIKPASTNVRSTGET